MDNLTHSLVGLALGELAHRVLPTEADPARASTRRRLLLSCGALASNFPDLDLVLTPLLPDPFGYLLHHRGHTHTLLYAPAPGPAAPGRPLAVLGECARCCGAVRRRGAGWGRRSSSACCCTRAWMR
ncbi:metal-dependent hydrolase [Massilia sp. Dwa41.01b]|uniref:metal-dependent hydrolase n=1 Tax=Massilia sp. Dwa41.01b TaxID=2709302 RepID=UPI001E386722|nr:metal-dependent hydrolase [Massilia sp. Dwa41.01b]